MLRATIEAGIEMRVIRPAELKRARAWTRKLKTQLGRVI